MTILSFANVKNWRPRDFLKARRRVRAMLMVRLPPLRALAHP